MDNPNGKNEIKLIVPCCDDEELVVSYKAKDNSLISDIFRTIAKRIGIDVKLAETKKGGG